MGSLGTAATSRYYPLMTDTFKQCDEEVPATMIYCYPHQVNWHLTKVPLETRARNGCYLLKLFAFEIVRFVRFS